MSVRGRGLEFCGFFAALVLSGCSSAGPAPAVEVSDGVEAQPRMEELTRNALTAAEAKTTLRLIDDICGDTWCDGDYDFGFRRLTCNQVAKTCTLTLQVFPIEGVVSKEKSYWRSCKTSGFEGFTSLVATAPNGYQSLQGDYYDALTECVDRIMSKLSAAQ
jgi:hypothetical protein